MEFNKEEIMKDPDTIVLTVHGIEIVVNKSKHYAGSLTSNITKEYFVKLVMYLVAEGFFD